MTVNETDVVVVFNICINSITRVHNKAISGVVADSGVLFEQTYLIISVPSAQDNYLVVVFYEKPTPSLFLLLI